MNENIMYLFILDLQHRLLLVTADHCEDTMEHCRLLLLLLKKFPQSIVSHGVSIVLLLTLAIPSGSVILIK